MPPKQHQSPYSLLYSIHADPNYDHSSGQVCGPNGSSTEQSSSQPTQSLVSGSQRQSGLSAPNNPSFSGSMLNPQMTSFSGFTSNPQTSSSSGFMLDPQISSSSGLKPGPQMPSLLGLEIRPKRRGPVPSHKISLKRRAPPDESAKLSTLPSAEVFRTMSREEKSDVMIAACKRIRMANERGSTQSVRQSSITSAGVVGPKVAPELGPHLGRPKGGISPIGSKMEPLGIDPLFAFKAKLRARTGVSGAVQPSSPRSTTHHTLEAPSSSSRSLEEATIRDAFKVDSHEGNALVRWIWEELSKDLQHSGFVALDSYRYSEMPLLDFTSAALQQLVVLPELVNLTVDIKAKLAEIHSILARSQYHRRLTDDMRQQLSEVFSGTDPAHHFRVQSLFSDVKDVRASMDPEQRQDQCILRSRELEQQLRKIYNNVKASEASFMNSHNKVLDFYSQRHSSHEYDATVRRFRESAECIGPVTRSNVLIAIFRLQEIDKKVCGLGHRYPGVHNVLSIVEQFYDRLYKEVRTIMASLFRKIIAVIIPFYLFEIDGDTHYQFLHGTGKYLGLYGPGRRFWCAVISELRSMMQPVNIPDEVISDVLSQYMVGKARISSHAAREVPNKDSGLQAPSPRVQLHTKPFPPDPSDIEGTGTRVRFSHLAIGEPVVLEVCPDEQSPGKEPHAASGCPGVLSK